MSPSQRPLGADFLDAAGAEPEAHPSAEELLAYHHHELEEIAIERIRSHLVDCSSCRQIVLDLAGYGKDEDPELGRAWQALDDRRRGVSTNPFESGSSPSPRPVERRHPLPLSLAAALASIAAGALLAWLALGGGTTIEELEYRVAELEGELRALRQPQLIVGAATLLPEGYLRDEIPTLELGPGARLVVLELAGADPLPETPHRLELRDDKGQLFWHGEGLVADDRGHFLLVLPTALLPDGAVEVRLFAPDQTDEIVFHLAIDPTRQGDTIASP